MADLSRILPDFPVSKYAGLLAAIERHQVTTSELLTLDVADLGKRTRLPLLDLRRLSNAVLEALHADLGLVPSPDNAGPKPTSAVVAAAAPDGKPSALCSTGAEIASSATHPATISTLDTALDAALGGGVPAGYVTEITGESGAGKTQFLLTLLLSVQLPPPYGLGRPALYISTESALSTKRLSQILRQNSFFANVDPKDRPSLDRVLSTVTPDLESQDHILQFQVPVEVARRNIGLLVLDSVAANYRAEFDREGRVGAGAGKGREGAEAVNKDGAVTKFGGSGMAARSNELIKLGALLHGLARKHNLAVVVANQVADRFSTTPVILPSAYRYYERDATTDSTSSSASNSNPKSPLPTSSLPTHVRAPPSKSTSTSTCTPTPELKTPNPKEPDPEPSLSLTPAPSTPPAPAALLLDHQQRWFTGWGDDPPPASISPSTSSAGLKTPSLGLVWSTQIAARVVLYKRAVYGAPRRHAAGEARENGVAVGLRAWRRWLKVVFAAHVGPSGQGVAGAVEFEIVGGGVRGVGEDG